MSGFEINLYSNKQEYYRFSTEDFALLELGIGNYNISSIANLFSVKDTDFSQIKPMNPDVKEFFSNQGAGSIIDKLIGKDSQDNMAIMEFNIETKEFVETKSFSEIKKLNTNKYKSDNFTPPQENDIKSFLIKWNDVQKGFIADPKVVNGYKAVAYKIQNSMSGCILFEADLTVLGEIRKSKIKLHLLDNADASSSRGLSFNGSPIFSAQPNTPYGMTYSMGETNAAPIGQFVGGNGNPNDMVAGKMRQSFDPSTGEWESGTQQMLVRLVDDIGVANVPTLTADQLLSLSREEIYDSGPDGPGYMGNFTKGKAIPLSSENGNPHMFGPDFKDGCESGNKVVITVINRLNQSYKAGSIVVVSRLSGDNGAWTIISAGTDGGTNNSKKIIFRNFEYQKYLIPLSTYFTANGNKITPSIVASRVRDNFYFNLAQDLASDNIAQVGGNVLQLLTNINRSSIVATINPNDSNLIKNIYTSYKAASPTPGNPYIAQDLLVFDFIANSYLGNFISPYFDEIKRPILPRNILRRSARIYNLISETYDQITPIEVPSFWGILFPDGYKTDQCKAFKTITDEIIFLTKGRPENDILGDPNLTELSCVANVSFPDLRNSLKNYQFIKQFCPQALTIPYLNNKIRRTGGMFFNPTTLTWNAQSLRKFISGTTPTPVGYTYTSPNIDNIFDPAKIDDGAIHGLEPIVPNRIQFSPLSIESLYSNETLDSLNFKTLKLSIDSYNKPYVDGVINTNIKNALKFASPFYDRDPSVDANESENDKGNIYTNANLSYNIFNSQILTRHTGPKGILNGIIPRSSLSQVEKLPVIPVLTCKSTILTNSNIISFTTNQYFGEVPIQTVVGGQQGQLTILPIGGGLAWQTPNNPLSVSSFPQWGDISRSDDIDSLGTTSLHVRIFEAWPANQTIFLGMLFTPLHFNPSEKLYKEVLSFDNDGIASITNQLDSDGNAILARSSVDFQIPVYKLEGEDEDNPFASPTIIKIGASVNKEKVAPMSDWLWSNCRRAQLLTNGGFVYLKPVFAISSCVVDPDNKGRGYKDGTIFTFPDGSTFTATASPITDNGGGQITGGDHKTNYDDEYILMDGSSGMLSLNNVTPTQSESGGSGVKFILKFTLVFKIGYDRPPIEIETIKRLTKPSNGNAYPNTDGDGPANGTLVTSISLEESKTNNYDIFYFFHNDPTHYTINSTIPFHRDAAQYVISEVQAG